jgi:hypothetical protein
MTYIYALNNADSSEATDILAAQIMERGSSNTSPQLASRLLSLLQQAKLLAALSKVTDSMKERSRGVNVSPPETVERTNK